MNDAAAVTGALTVKGKDGDDFSEQTTNAAVGSDLVLALGNGPNAVALNPFATVGGNVSLKAGASDDTIDTTDTVATGGSTINAGNGTNTIVP